MVDITEDAPDDESKRNYDVGYGKPPASGKFKPGRSGNPRGRRKGEPNMKTFVIEEMGRRHWVTVDGKRRLLSNRQLVVLAQINKARKGDPKAFQALMAHDEALARETADHAQRQDLSPEEREILQNHLDYVARKQPEDDHEG